MSDSELAELEQFSPLVVIDVLGHSLSRSSDKSTTGISTHDTSGIPYSMRISFRSLKELGKMTDISWIAVGSAPIMLDSSVSNCD